MTAPQELAPAPAEANVNARIAELEAAGYMYEACIQPEQGPWIVHNPFMGADDITHVASSSIEDPLDRLDYFNDCIRRSKLGNFDVVYILEAGIPTKEELEAMPEDERWYAEYKVTYKPGATTFMTKPL